jgi:hypothetical protein
VPDHHRGIKKREQTPALQDDHASPHRNDSITATTNAMPPAEKPFSIQSLLTTDEARMSTLLSSTTYASMQQSATKYDILQQPARQVLPIENIVAAKVVSRKHAATFIQL